MLVVKKSPANSGDAGDVRLIPGFGRSPGGGNVNPLQYSHLENPIDRGAWLATVHEVTKNQTWLSIHTHTLTTTQYIIQKCRHQWRRQWQAIPVLLPGESCGRRSPVGYTPWGCKESDTTEQLHFHFQNSMSILCWQHISIQIVNFNKVKGSSTKIIKLYVMGKYFTLLQF